MKLNTGFLVCGLFISSLNFCASVCASERKIIDIRGLDKVRILQELALTAGVSRGHVWCFSDAKAQEILEKSKGGRIIYLAGMRMDVDLSGDTLDVEAFDRIYGEGSAEAAVTRATDLNVVIETFVLSL